MGRCNHYGCGDEAEDGKKQCRPHLDAASKYQTRRRADLIRDGKCTRCGGESRPKMTMCQTCADTWNEYLRGRRAAKA